MSAEIHTGRVKFYSLNKSYGFITDPEGTDYFFGGRDLLDVFDRPFTGDKVSFKIAWHGKNKCKAYDIEKIK